MPVKLTSILLASVAAGLLGNAVLIAQERVERAKDGSAGIDWNSMELQDTDTATMGLSDNLIPRDRGFRLAMGKRGWSIRFNTMTSMSQNVLDGPVAADEQVYVGQRGTEQLLFNPIITYNMQGLGLKDAQLVASVMVNRVSWKKNGPNATALHYLYMYKGFMDKRLEFKAGYITNNWEFICLQVGGSIASGSQGVFAVLPNEVGLSRTGLTAPSASMRVQYTSRFSTKFGVQRSLDPDGGQKTQDRNYSGFRFDPKGLKLLTIAEAGYKIPSSDKQLYIWVRTGFLYNTSAYNNFVTGGRTSGNYNVFLLADQQLSHSGTGGVSNGYYLGGSAMANPHAMNIYSRYYELRIYKKGTTARRTHDMFSVVMTHTGYSPDYTRNLEQQGKSFWRNATTVSGNYIWKFRAGLTGGVGATYNTSPAVTPRVRRALIPTAQMNYFF